MLDICFGSSECGTLKCGLKTTHVTYSYFGLELGEISSESFDFCREKWVDDFFRDLPKKERDKIKRDQKERFKKIIDAAKSGEQLRIWFASSPCSKCGYYHLIYELRDFNCDISVVEMPKEAGIKRAGDNSWGEVNVWDIEKYIPLTHNLARAERQRIADLWKKLAKENAPLRLNINGVITSVPEDYLDEEILSYAPKGQYKLGRHIAECLVRCTHGLSDGFYAGRIIQLARQGKLRMVNEQKRPNFYSSILEKSNLNN